jgi:hypothetical protein
MVVKLQLADHCSFRTCRQRLSRPIQRVQVQALAECERHRAGPVQRQRLVGQHVVQANKRCTTHTWDGRCYRHKHDCAYSHDVGNHPVSQQ